MYDYQIVLKLLYFMLHKLFMYHLVDYRVPLAVGVPLIKNYCSMLYLIINTYWYTLSMIKLRGRLSEK